MMFLFGLAHLSASTCRGDRNAHNDFLVDHGLGISDDHFIINITELASVNHSILIRSIPVVDFNPQKFEDCVECVICLSELADGTKPTFTEL
ncbi:hypothetical protein DY000_02010425 [Brassica cretica]|uniref:Uncharacterized protein n=1 Tax=Brassica cretica TaxID=69181 RepID=A0ABQ7CBI9_BRACR|nr:hypothetical protein DY000_02010425 [Brassica cretica]